MTRRACGSPLRESANVEPPARDEQPLLSLLPPDDHRLHPRCLGAAVRLDSCGLERAIGEGGAANVQALTDLERVGVRGARGANDAAGGRCHDRAPLDVLRDDDAFPGGRGRRRAHGDEQTCHREEKYEHAFHGCVVSCVGVAHSRSRTAPETCGSTSAV